MYEMKLVRPLLLNVKEYGSELYNPMYFFSVFAIRTTPKDPDNAIIVTSNGLQYTTDKRPEELVNMFYECCSELKTGGDKANEEEGQKKSSAVALYLILAGRAVIDERGDLVDESEYPHGLRVRKDALVGTAPLYPTISTRFDPAEFSDPVSNSIKRDSRNMMSKEEFDKWDTAPMSKEREEEIDKWIESDSPVKITGSAKDRAALQEIDRAEEPEWCGDGNADKEARGSLLPEE